MKTKHGIFLIIAFLLTFSLVLSGCGALTDGGDPTATLRPLFEETPLTTQSPLLPLNPTPTPDLNSLNPVQITELEFLQEDQELLIMGKLFNTLSDAILRDVQLEVLALDAVGNRVAQRLTSFRYLFPRETTGLVQEFELNAGLEVASVEVRVIDGLVDQDLKYEQPLTVQNTSAFKQGNDYLVTGWLGNADAYTYTQVALNAVAYNEKGQIVGGGTSLIDFVPEEDQIGFSLLANSRKGETVDHVDVHPWLTSYSSSLEGGKWWDSIEKGEWNFAIDRYNQLTGGAILTNQTDQILTETYLILTVSDENNRVCQSVHEYYDVIWPEEEVLYAPAPLTLPKDCQGSQVDFVVIPGEFGEFPVEFNPLLTSQLFFADDETVNVSVINNLNASVSAARVYVVLQDSEGRVVGGGYHLTGSIRPGSSISVKVPVAYLGDPEMLSLMAFATLPANVTFGQ